MGVVCFFLEVPVCDGEKYDIFISLVSLYLQIKWKTIQIFYSTTDIKYISMKYVKCNAILKSLIS